MASGHRHSFETVKAVLIALYIGFAIAGSAQGDDSHDIRRLLVGGVWVRHLDDVRFFSNGTYEANDQTSDRAQHGKWRLHGHLLRMTKGGKNMIHRIVSIDAGKLEMTFGDGTEGLAYARSGD